MYRVGLGCGVLRPVDKYRVGLGCGVLKPVDKYRVGLGCDVQSWVGLWCTEACG